jgi:hypothetical protein
MFWTSAMKLVGAAAVSAGASGTVAATIVIRSSGPSAATYPTGRSLPETQMVSLKIGDTLVVLDAKGTRTLKGPGTYAIGARTGTPAGPTRLAALIGNSGARQVRTGAVRGATGTATPRMSSLWSIDTSRSGTICLRDANRAMLWRAAAAEPLELKLSDANGKSVALSFAAGQATRTWPMPDMPIGGGGAYRISGPGLSKPTELRIALISSPSDAADEIAAALIAKGCLVQLDALAEAGKSVVNEG